MRPECVNGGGPESLLRLEMVPTLEQAAPLVSEASASLRIWQARPGEILTVVDPQQTFYRARLITPRNNFV